MSIKKSLLISTAGFVLAAFATQAAFAEGRTVSKGVAKPLQAAQAASKARKWSECLTQLHTAEGAAGKTDYDTFIINELLGACAAGAGDYASAAKALEASMNSEFFAAGQQAGRLKTLMQINYTLKAYDKAIDIGNRAVKAGTADNELQTLLAQSYYQKGDYKATKAFTAEWIAAQEKRGQQPRESLLQINLDSCIKIKDEPCTTRTFEKLVTSYPKPEYWQNLMRSMFREGGDDKTKLNVFRLAVDVGSMRRGDDYAEMAQLAIEQGLASEAQAALEAGFARKAFTEQRDIDRNTRLLAAAKTRAATEKAGLAQADKAAAAGAKGDADVVVGESYMGQGQYAQAVVAIKRGLAKGNVTNPGAVQTTLGIALLKSGAKAEAAQAFKSVKGDDAQQRLAKLWALRVR
jgi:tetratricopeptide (TPR) repeat protein